MHKICIEKCHSKKCWAFGPKSQNHFVVVRKFKAKQLAYNLQSKVSSNVLVENM